MLTAPAHAKLNLALVVGPLRPDARHEIVTVVEKLSLADSISVRPAESLTVTGFADDTLVRDALLGLARKAGLESGFAVTIEKRVPVAAGLGGGSSDAATALRLGNALLPCPLDDEALQAIAGRVGSDVPLFLRGGPVLATGDGTTVEPASLPRGYHVVLWLPAGTAKSSTGAIYDAFDRRGGPAGFDQRRDALTAALRRISVAGDLADLPPNDLASSPLAGTLRTLGAFRADVTGAGPACYGLFHYGEVAAAAAAELADRGQVWTTTPADDA